MAAIPKVNPVLMLLAMQAVEREKRADPGMPPGGGGGGMDPAMMGGGGMPPGGGGGMDPSMMGGAPPAPAPAPAAAAPAAAPAAQAGPPKLKAEDMIRAMDYRVYNLQMQLTAIMNALKINLPAGALVTPPGSFAAPQAELAAPGGPQDPTQGPAAQGGGQSAIQPIDPMQGASPALAQGGGGGGGGGTKQGSAPASIGQAAGVKAAPTESLNNNVAALASLLRSRSANNGR